MSAGTYHGSFLHSQRKLASDAARKDLIGVAGVAPKTPQPSAAAAANELNQIEHKSTCWPDLRATESLGLAA